MLILTSAQKQLNQAELKLIQNVKTRWNSEFYTLERVNELKDALVIALVKIPALEPLTTKEWLMCEELIKLLKPLEWCSRELCGTSYLTISKMLTQLRILYKNLSQVKLKSTELLKLLFCFCEIEKHEIIGLATLLDPRFKKC